MRQRLPRAAVAALLTLGSVFVLASCGSEKETASPTTSPAPAVSAAQPDTASAVSSAAAEIESLDADLAAIDEASAAIDADSTPEGTNP